MGLRALRWLKQGDENEIRIFETLLHHVDLFAVFIGLFCSGLPAAAQTATEYKIVNTDQVKEMFAQKQTFILIDSRSSQEYQEARIKDAINIPEKELQKNIALLPADKSVLLVIYCNGVKCGKSKKKTEENRGRTYTLDT